MRPERYVLELKLDLERGLLDATARIRIVNETGRLVLERLDGVSFVLDIAVEEGLHVWQTLNAEGEP